MVFNYIYMLSLPPLGSFRNKETAVSPHRNYYFFISWRLITLQYCSGFCHTLTWISREYTCIPHPNPPSHLPLHLIPLGLPSAPDPALVSCIQPGLVICFTLDNIHVLCCSLKTSHPCLLPQGPKDCSILLCLFFCFAYAHQQTNG